MQINRAEGYNIAEGFNPLLMNSNANVIIKAVG